MKVGIVGTGHIAEVHIRAIRAAPDATVVGVADSFLEYARAFAERLEIAHAYESASSLIDAARPDVVHVLTPPATHHKVVVECLAESVGFANAAIRDADLRTCRSGGAERLSPRDVDLRSTQDHVSSGSSNESVEVVFLDDVEVHDRDVLMASGGEPDGDVQPDRARARDQHTAAG